MNVNNENNNCKAGHICNDCKHNDICKWTAEMDAVKENAVNMVASRQASPIFINVDCKKFEKPRGINEDTLSTIYGEKQRDFDYTRRYMSN